MPFSFGNTGVGGAGPQQIRPANSTRAYLRFQNCASGTIQLDIDPNVGSNGSAFQLQTGQMVEIFWERFGILTTLAWYANASTPIGNIFWAEMRWEPSQ